MYLKFHPHILKQGGWCPQCLKTHRRKERHMQKLRNIAESKGGICISEEYIDNHTKLKFQCGKGHVFEIPPAYIKAGGWCSECSKEARRKRQTDKLRRVVASKGAKLIGGEYIHTESKLTFQCKEGHIWETIAST